MKIFNKVAIVILTITFAFGLNGPTPVFAAATAPVLGAMSNFSVLAGSSMSADGAGVTVSGAMGLSTGDVTSRTGLWLPVFGRTEYFGALSLAKTAQDDATAAKIFMATEGTDGVWGSITPAPGVYTSASSPTFNGTLTLTGSATDVWVFNLTTDFTFAGNVVLAGEAQACNVFWQIGRDVTINSGGAGTKFVGTLIAGNTVTMGTGVTVNGRIMAGPEGSFTGAGDDIISGPTCTVASATSGTPREGTINVVKHVINDSGRTKTVADFPLFVSGVPVVSGITNTFHAPAGVYIITETIDPNYTQSFSGDCDATGRLNLIPGDNKFCIITNNDIGSPIITLPVPPLIDVVKVPSPLSLPNGPGLVNYTYTLRNIGTVPVSNVTMVGDTCSPIVLASGDLNSDAKLNVNETWVYKCSTILQETHTNTVVATGWANGIAATDIASANVVVGIPIVPPLIHITKVPNTFTLAAGGGMVTYTKTVTNPGTEPLSNVKVTDDKCGPITYISGDTNNDTKLDPSETWIYTCKTNLTATTLNTAFATGEANGLVARDFALATVVVAAPVPALPATGLHDNSWILIALSCLFVSLSASLFVVYKKNKI